jgi:hypothetical protein
VSGAAEPAAGGDVAESLRELSSRIEQLQGEVRRQGTVLPVPATAAEASTEPSYAWLSALEPPQRRRPAVPRLVLEVLFLAAVAVAAALAELDAAAIAGVMAVAWVLVALIEWASSRADRRRADIMLRPPPEPPQPLPADPSWYVPPVEHTLLETPALESTGSGRLPAAPREDEPAPAVETTAERRD